MRNNGRRIDEIREIEITYNNSKQAIKSCNVKLGLTNVQVNIYESDSPKIITFGKVNYFDKKCIEQVNDFIYQNMNKNLYIEQFIISDDGSVATAICEAMISCLEDEIQNSNNIKGITLGSLKNEVIFDLDFEETKNISNKAFLIKEIDGSIISFATEGKMETQELSDVLVLGQGKINQNEKAVKKDKEMNKEIIIATKNKGKAQEFEMMFSKYGYTVKTLLDFPELPDIVENGKTFTENAAIKAETLSKHLNLPVLGDDSGLCVDALKGMPGIYSARFAGDHNDAANNAKLLSELAGVEELDRTAHFHTSLVFAAPGKENLVVEGEVEGLIAEFPEGENGFGYDPLFYLPELGKTMAELTKEQKNQISHRAMAMQKLAKVWQEWLEGEA